ncbi:MAG: hypothetical protein PHC29_05740 [Candidatus Omnitrophica bacterium]|nr:hypothetical protein [Candidatus Omnitrophota bacterium]
MEILLNIITGGLSGALLVWLLRGWITERLKQSIQHEYAQKLETHKAELNAKLQAVLYEQQIYQLRTSLFFDHQREAFAALLSQIAEIERKWLEVGYDPDLQEFTKSVPSEEYYKLKKSFYDHQLFLDRDCIFAMNLVLEAMSDSFPVDDGNGELHERVCREPYERLKFLHSRVAELFREKIGIAVSVSTRIELAFLGAIRLLNQYHFADIGLPPKGELCLTARDSVADAVAKAVNNKAGLISKLKEFKAYLEKDHSFFYEALEKVTLYLNILENKNSTV